MAIPTTIGQILFLTTLGILGLFIARITRLDTTLACLLTGVLGGLAIPVLQIDTGIRASNIQNLVFYIILPVLVFEAAWHMKPKVLKRWLRPIFLLATVGVLLSCSLVALGTFYGINHPAGFPFIAALLTGAILAATDPSAVVATVKKLNAPDDLGTLIEGESLFNDATAILLFTVVLSFALSAHAAPSEPYLTLFITTFFGGIVVGCVLGLIAAIICLALGTQSAATLTLVALAFAGFYIAENLLHVSGIMSVMAAALTTKVLLDEHQDKLLRHINPTWEWLGLLLNMVVFVLVGLVINVDMFRERWLAILIAIAATVIARFIAVYTIGYTTRWSTRPISAGWQLIISWGGIRGIIAIVLALSLPTSLPYWWTIQSMVFGVVIFSLIVQGLTTGTLIKKYAANSTTQY